MAITNTVYRCRSLMCDHNVSSGDDFCAECTTLLKTEAEKLKPLPLTPEEEAMRQYVATVALDPVVEANRQLLLQRSNVGVKKYGGTLHQMQYSQRQILQHALEEALDLANYLQAEIQRIDAQAA